MTKINILVIIVILILICISLFWMFLYEVYKPKIELRKSKIHNRGIFAKKDIRRGDIVEEVPLISNIKLKNIENSMLRDYVISMPTRFNKDGDVRCSIMLGLGSLYNHSDNNNAKWEFESEEKIIIRAVKNIYSDEEIFVDYGKGYWEKRNNYKKMN